MNEEDHKRIDNSTAALVSNTELRTLRLDPSQLQLACEQDVFDTKFWLNYSSAGWDIFTGVCSVGAWLM